MKLTETLFVDFSKPKFSFIQANTFIPDPVTNLLYALNVFVIWQSLNFLKVEFAAPKLPRLSGIQDDLNTLSMKM